MPGVTTTHPGILLVTLNVRSLCRCAREVEPVHEPITTRNEPRIEQVLARGVGEPTLKFVSVVTCKHECVQQRTVINLSSNTCAALTALCPVSRPWNPGIMLLEE
eukprot:COSAG02_NODE_9113_length_2325_cov_2.303235_3_plen_105_part_00